MGVIGTEMELKGTKMSFMHPRSSTYTLKIQFVPHKVQLKYPKFSLCSPQS